MGQNMHKERTMCVVQCKKLAARSVQL